MKAHALAAAAFFALPLIGASGANGAAAEKPTAEPQQNARNVNPRFRAMDTDGDGRVTRAEWRGNDRSFRNHDWNNDGVLSGDELRVNATRQRSGADDTGFYDWTT